MRIPIPFLKKEIGLGQAIKAATTAVGVPPCGGCNQRAESLDKIITLVPPQDGAEDLPVAEVGKSYQHSLPGMVVGGSIPPGMQFSPRAKLLMGTPTQAGVYGLTVALDATMKHFKLEVR